MDYTYLNKPIDLLKLKLYIDPRELYECDESEILKLEDTHPFGESIPKSFKEFLIFGGKGIGYLNPSSDFYYGYILKTTENLKKFHLDKGYYWRTIIEPLPKDALIFSQNQGYEFLFIRMNESNDPQVFHACEGEERFNVLAEKFSIYFQSIVTNHIALYEYQTSTTKRLLASFKSITFDIIDLFSLFEETLQIQLFKRSYENMIPLIYDLLKGRNVVEGISSIQLKLTEVDYFHKLDLPFESKTKLTNKMEELRDFFNIILPDIRK